MSERIKLNVGGQHFETTKDTLIRAPYFEALLSRWISKEKEIFIDRSGSAFNHVLNLLRNPDYNFPHRYQEELNFYGVDLHFLPNCTGAEARSPLGKVVECIANWSTLRWMSVTTSHLQ